MSIDILFKSIYILQTNFTFRLLVMFCFLSAFSLMPYHVYHQLSQILVPLYCLTLMRHKQQELGIKLKRKQGKSTPLAHKHT